MKGCLNIVLKLSFFSGFMYLIATTTTKQTKTYKNIIKQTNTRSVLVFNKKELFDSPFNSLSKLFKKKFIIFNVLTQKVSKLLRFIIFFFVVSLSKLIVSEP